MIPAACAMERALWTSLGSHLTDEGVIIKETTLPWYCRRRGHRSFGGHSL